MEKVICTIKSGSLKEIPMKLRRKFAWLLESSLVHTWKYCGITLQAAKDSDHEISAGMKQKLVNLTRIPHFKFFMDAEMEFQITDNDNLYGEWQGIKIHVRDFSDAWSLFQFAYDYYDFSVLNNLKEVTVLDIGAHVGISTCYFSKHPSVGKVFSYEPFKENHEQLLLNLELNPYVSNKAFVENTGVSGKAEKVILPFYPNASLHSGLNISDFFRKIHSFFDYSFSSCECVLQDINIIIERLPKINPILIFINAKGLEREILCRLFSSVDTSLICAIVGHFNNNFGIEQLFTNNGFDFRYHPHSITSGIEQLGVFSAFRKR